MKRFILYIWALFMSLSAFSQESAKSVVERFLHKVEQQTLSSDFTMTISEQASQPLSYNGALRMRDTRFTLNMFDTRAAYDGNTLYLYSEDTNELTLSTPTPEELLEANPVLFAKALMLQASLTFSAAGNKDDVYSIDFVPNYQTAGIKKFVLKLQKSTLLPLLIEVREGKQTTTIRFKTPKFEQKLPDFTLQVEGAFLNDMR